MRTKAIFLDLDGTLLDDEKRITSANNLAIQKAIRAGHKVIIATGRPLGSAVSQAEQLGLRKAGCFLIAFNGGILYDLGESRVLHRHTMSIETMRSVFHRANERKLHIHTYEDECVIVEPIGVDVYLQYYLDIVKIPYRVEQSIDSYSKMPSKCIVLHEDQSKLLAFSEYLKTEVPDVDSFLSTNTLLEIVPHGLNKGNAIESMAKMLNIPLDNTIAVGDAPNDSSMILRAGLGVCMCNGYDEVKKLADYVTENDNNHSGVAEVIEKFLLSD